MAQAPAPAPKPSDTPPPANPADAAGGNPSPSPIRSTPDAAPVSVPEKFLRDGKPDYAALVASYTELEGQLHKKPDDLKAAWEAERLAKRPESADKYALPKADNIDSEELAKHPLTAWWRETAHAQGLNQEQFEKGILDYAEKLAPQIDAEAEIKKLGDNATARMSAVEAWVKKFSDKPEQYKRLVGLTVDAAGIELIEQLMGTGTAPVNGAPSQPAAKITREKLESMQQDPRYWKAASRDPDFVRQVDEGFKQLYGG